MSLPDVMQITVEELEIFARELRQEASCLEDIDPNRAKKLYAAACALTGDAIRLRARDSI